MQYAPRELVVPAGSAEGIWGWRSHLPTIAPQARITLGEGATHLLPVDESDAGPTVYLKNETSNPTWSWKDRPNAISVSVAKHFGFERVVLICGPRRTGQIRIVTSLAQETTQTDCEQCLSTRRATNVRR